MIRRLLPPILLLTLLPPQLAHALDKQGPAHGGLSLTEDSTATALSGSLSLGASIYNPTYAARPDNTGIALMRYAAHIDFDLLGRYLSLPLDLNFFTDRLRKGALVLSPTEFDVIAGVSSTVAYGPGELELGLRVERDLPLDEGSYSQTYVDARARYVVSLADVFPKLEHALSGGDISGWLTLGWFVFNPTYAARPDNTGIALLRYAFHTEISTLQQHLALGLDGTMFTDRDRHTVRPTELDGTVELIGRWRTYEAHLAYERDMPLDQPGLVQQMAYLLFSHSFSWP